jgi:UDP-3-O-acyl N-acetylglucosamine deacetylase
VRRLSYRYQRTIGAPVEVCGVGFLTGAAVRLRFVPAALNTGVAFVRTDLPHARPISARVDQVTGTQRRTTLGHPPQRVELVEHVLAALAGLRIDNCCVELNAPEPPGLDGSAQRFVAALQRAGTVLQPARRAVWTVTEPVIVGQNGATLALHPAAGNELKVTYTLDYGLKAAIGRQSHTSQITPELFVHDLADCRTFLLESEAVELRRQGLGSRTTFNDLLVFGARGPLRNRLRHADEPARHKVLDLVGDLALFGQDLRGHVVAYRSGHALNIELVRALTERLSEQAPPALLRVA